MDEGMCPHKPGNMKMDKKNVVVGMQVKFGREGGEQTLGKVVKKNRKKLKIEQLESRGTFKAYPVGTLWTVPEELVTPVTLEAGMEASAPAKTVDIALPPKGHKPRTPVKAVVPPAEAPMLIDVKTGKRFVGQPGETAEMLFDRLRAANPGPPPSPPAPPAPAPSPAAKRRDINLQ